VQGEREIRKSYPLPTFFFYLQAGEGGGSPISLLFTGDKWPKPYPGSGFIGKLK
jgi:hypothetical protein